jgi:proteasome assembly chaperone (PAC2) family protein
VKIVYNIESDLGSAMGIRLCQEPRLESPILAAGWPGIGNIGIIAVDTLKGILEAEELVQIEFWEFSVGERA